MVHDPSLALDVLRDAVRAYFRAFDRYEDMSVARLEQRRAWAAAGSDVARELDRVETFLRDLVAAQH